MEDVADGLLTAWGETLRGVKKGYKYTTKVLKKIPRLTDDRREGTSASQSHRRRVFQERYASPVSGSRNASQSIEEESSDSASSDSEALTDEQVKSVVDCQYFDPEYDPVSHEIKNLPEVVPKDEEAILSEIAMVDQKIRNLRQQCAVVSNTLKKRVLANHHSFVSGIEHICALNNLLCTTSSDCKKSRAALKKAKGDVASRLKIVAMKRSLDHCESTAEVLRAIEALKWKQMQLDALLSSGKVVEAAQFLEKKKEIALEEVLVQIHCMKETVENWKTYCSQPKKLLEHVELVLRRSFTEKFLEDVYLNAVESFFALFSSSECCSFVETLLWQTAGSIFTRSLAQVSFVKDENAPISDIVAGIEPPHLLIGLASMSARWMDFFYVFRTVRKLHADAVASMKSSVGDKVTGTSTVIREDVSPSSGLDLPREAAVHHDLSKRIERLSSRLGRDLLVRLTLAIGGCTSAFADLDTDHLVHLFVLVDLTIEAVKITFDVDQSDVEAARSELLEMLCTALRMHVYLPQLEDLVKSMNSDSWEAMETSVESIAVLSNVDGSFYNAQVRLVQDYLQLPLRGGVGACHQPMPLRQEEAGKTHEKGSRGNASGVGISRELLENPFRLPSLMYPQDTSRSMQSTTLGEYQRSSSLSTSIDNQETISRSVSDLTSTPSRSFSTSIVSTSALQLYNLLMTSQLKIVRRFPPVAPFVLQWCEEWVNFYIFTIFDNFISISRSIPLESQGDFSSAAQKILHEMRLTAEKAVNANNGTHGASSPKSEDSIRRTAGSSHSLPSGGPTNVHSSSIESIVSQKFPPRVIDGIRTLFISEADYYAVVCRTVACASSHSLAALYEFVIRSFSTFFEDPEEINNYLYRCEQLKSVTEEGLHVCLHRLSEALLPMPKVCEEINRLRVRKEEVEVSSYVMEAVLALQRLHENRPSLPTAELDTLFIQRSIFSVQCLMVREYSKLSKKMNDMLAMQLQVDAQNFTQQIASSLGAKCVVFPRHVLTLVKTGFFLQDKDQSVMWMAREHKKYNAEDMLSWFSSGDRQRRGELEGELKALKHIDCLPISDF